MLDNKATLKLTERKTQQIVWTILFCGIIIGMAIDLIAPSLPAIAVNLHVTNNIAKNAISIYLLGYGLGNFFIGFITDALGRRNLLRAGLLAFLIVSLIPPIFNTIQALLLARFLQGCTLGAIGILARVILSDVLSSEKLVRAGTILGTVWGLGPVFGPIIGGYLQVYFGWQAGFYFFALLAFITFTLVFSVIPETHFNRVPLNIKTIKKNLADIITNRSFMALVILMGLSYALIISFNTAGPFLIQSSLNYSPVFFGHLALWLGIGFLIGTFFCRYFLKKYKVEKLFHLVINLFFFIICLATMASYFFEKNILLIGLCSAFMYFCCGFIFPLSMGQGLSLYRHISGTASAAMYLVNILLASLIGYLVSFIAVKTAIYLMTIYLIIMLLCMIVYWGMIHKKNS